ncbi:hypothetical protein GSI_09628 [Ganoderma sinense ZZ0214-1]|uniref:BZIP domain-containing protein n=1 Tax=Ganoderma sinense ZZ0214-1 TaxID=1077348 RepID=A0A2G8S367_9APHY|nr:hypothetical protein GSI_09628 [Ganoderma sinense ZZ0214-1]
MIRSHDPSFEDFFNMDLFAGPSNPTAGLTFPRLFPSSSSTPIALSPSPFFTLSQDDDQSKLSIVMPLQPLQLDATSFRPSADSQVYQPSSPTPLSSSPTSITLSPSPFLTLSQDNDQSKLSIVPPATTAAGYDFLSAYASQLTHVSGPESSGSVSFSGVSADSPSIDPQLMHTPVASRASISRMLGRKATKSTPSSDPDDWRPAPEEYKKMLSKGKRQLRNKISAHNFRAGRAGVLGRNLRRRVPRNLHVQNLDSDARGLPSSRPSHDAPARHGPGEDKECCPTVGWATVRDS